MDLEQLLALLGTLAIAQIGLTMALKPRFALLVGRILRFGRPLPPDAAPVFQIVGGVLSFMGFGILAVYLVRQILHHGT